MLIWYEDILALEALMEEQQNMGVELLGTDAVVVPFKQHQLLVFTTVLRQ